MPLSCSTVTDIREVDARAWDALAGDDDPFVEHAFLAALEASKCVGPVATGWVPRHVLVHDGAQLVGAMPLYEKHDSYGEFIFDWAWAEASFRAGIPYYPKLVAAVPFTPATGERLLVAAAADRSAITGRLLGGARAVADAVGASSLHVLFCPPEGAASLAGAGLLPRMSSQFHWHRAPGWHTFDDFLAALRSPARKQIRRERATAHAHGLTLSMRRGAELTRRDWQALYHFYRGTTAEKGSRSYLTPAFFAALAGSLCHRVVAALAHDGDEPVAGALCFTKGRHLYGRYWGAAGHFDALHFELCYYQPIAWALTHGITRFEAGAQGEHKVKRGLLPATCHSAHWLRHPGLARAVANFLAHEAAGVRAQMAVAARATPFPR